MITQHDLQSRLQGVFKYQSQIPWTMKVLAITCFFGFTYLGSVFGKLWVKFRTLLARLKKPERDYDPADYPDNWTL